MAEVAPSVGVQVRLRHCLSDNDLVVILLDRVFGNLQIERSGSLAYAAGDIVVGPVAWTEPTAVVAGLPHGYTSKVGAHAHHH